MGDYNNIYCIRKQNSYDYNWLNVVYRVIYIYHLGDAVQVSSEHITKYNPLELSVNLCNLELPHHNRVSCRFTNIEIIDINIYLKKLLQI